MPSQPQARSPQTPGIVAGRLAPDEISRNFTDIAPAFTAHEAAVAADRCYFCHDAPCVDACPTTIDIPLFIRQIATDQPITAARTILSQNILGGMCARVCPTETLCEEACVREAAEERPVEIGRLQRYATDAMMARGTHPFTRAAQSGRSVAVIGAGPAGLACAHRLAMLGHEVILHDERPKGGGLNEFGIAAYKTVDDFAQAELAWLLKIGGITPVRGKAPDLNDLREKHDAVFIGAGLGAPHTMILEGDGRPLRPATAFIAELRQAGDLTSQPVGRRVVVIGGGMTAVDAAVQSKLLGAEEVTIVYRRGREQMRASRHEQDHATDAGVRILCNAVPKRWLRGAGGDRIEFAHVRQTDQGPRETGEVFELAADQALAAIGQAVAFAPDGLEIAGGRIRITGAGRTSLNGVWAGGDCTSAGEDLTVTAVAQGRDAALDIHKSFA